jgi:hypothetical protein
MMCKRCGVDREEADIEDEGDSGFCQRCRGELYLVLASLCTETELRHER